MHKQDTGGAQQYVMGSKGGHDDHRTAPESSGHCVSTARMTGSDKGHSNHETVPEWSRHCLSSQKLTGTRKITDKKAASGAIMFSTALIIPS